MKLIKKTKNKFIDGLWEYAFEESGKITLADCWKAIEFICGIGDVGSIWVVEMHDPSDATVAGEVFDDVKEFSDWASKQEDKPESEGGYELDHAVVNIMVGEQNIRFEVAPLPTFGPKDRMIIFVETTDKSIGDKVVSRFADFKL